MEPKVAHTHSPGPGSLNTGPRKLGPAAPGERKQTRATQERSLPWAHHHAGSIGADRSCAQEYVAPYCAAPVPDTGCVEWGESAWGSTLCLLVQVEGKQEQFPMCWQKSES